MTWWDDHQRARIRAGANPLTGDTPGERRFKLAALELISEGVYPSGRQIYKKLGKNVDRKVNLNGRECAWLAKIRELFLIEPCVSYTPRAHRADWNDWVWGQHDQEPDFLYRLRRGKNGKLVPCEEWVDAELELRREEGPNRGF